MPPCACERGEVVEHAGLGVLERERRAERPRQRQRHVDRALPRPLTPRSSFTIAVGAAQLAQRPQDVAFAGDVEAARVRHALLGEDPPAAGLRPQPLERGVGAVERDAEPDGELDLVAGRSRTGEERELGLRDERADPLDRARALEQLLRQRLVAAVDERDDGEAAARLGRVELRDEAEVVVDQARQDRLRGDVDDARVPRAQQAEHEAEEPLLVGGKTGMSWSGTSMLSEWTTTTVRSTSPIERSVTDGHRARSRC